MRTAQEYANLHRAYLKVAKPQILKVLAEDGELTMYLNNVGQSAVEQYEALEARMMVDPSLPTDPVQRMAALEAIPLTVDEIVRENVIYQPS